MHLVVNTPFVTNVNVFPKWGNEVRVGDRGGGPGEGLGTRRVEGLQERDDPVSVDLQ